MRGPGPLLSPRLESVQTLQPLSTNLSKEMEVIKENPMEILERKDILTSWVSSAHSGPHREQHH